MRWSALPSCRSASGAIQRRSPPCRGRGPSADDTEGCQGRLHHYPLVDAHVWNKEWVMHCQPVGSGQEACRSLALSLLEELLATAWAWEGTHARTVRPLTMDS